MKRKIISLLTTVVLILSYVISPLAVGVNDASEYVSKEYFNETIASIRASMSELKPAMNKKTADSYDSYFSANDAIKEGSGIKITKKDNKWEITKTGAGYQVIDNEPINRNALYLSVIKSGSSNEYYNVLLRAEESPTNNVGYFLVEVTRMENASKGQEPKNGKIRAFDMRNRREFETYTSDGGDTWSDWKTVKRYGEDSDLVYDLSFVEAPALQDIYPGNVFEVSKGGNYQSITLPRGIYKLEVWGASGMDVSSSKKGGRGGYSVGTLQLDEDTTLYLYSGEAGNRYLPKDQYTFNGGAGQGTNVKDKVSSGGGGSDISIRGGQWDLDEHLYNRIIVAGGGGGAAVDVDSDGSSGCGGGVIGGSGSAGTGSAAEGGRQISGGKRGNTDDTTAETSNGYWACGGYGSGTNGGGGGGGGWYGGGGGYDRAGAGGSGYVYTLSTKENHPNKDSLGEKYCLGSAQTIGGNEDFPSPSGGTETGHSGDGFCRITVLDKETKSTKNFYDLSIESAPNPDELKAGDVIVAPYTGKSQQVSLPKGRFKFEVWGASGGNGTTAPNSNGLGGYSVGIIDFQRTEQIYMLSGGAGKASDTSSDYSITYGGWNGGGDTRRVYSSVGSGGGASDIRLSLNDYDHRILVAGGGGGSGQIDNSSSPGDGGGRNGKGYMPGDGNKSYDGNAEFRWIGNYGTQTKGGKLYAYESGASGNSKAGSFGEGASFYNNSNNYSGGGGGGGWYGGGATSKGGGGGGSGYTFTSTFAKYHPYGANISSKYYLTYAKCYDGSQEFPATSGGTETGHIGNGYSKITVLETDYKPVHEDTIDLSISEPPIEEDIMVGDQINLPSCEDSIPVTLPKGKYKLEVWGAEGGKTQMYNSHDKYNIGGKGGYTYGILTLKDSTTVYMSAGHEGRSGWGALEETYGGGGKVYALGNYTSSGGGGSDIRALADDLEHRIIVAGGGGGAGANNRPGEVGGYGGGVVGGKPYSTNPSSALYANYYAKPGTQTEGGAVATTDSYKGSAGTFGKGGTGAYSSYTDNGAGGGGGWYGGAGARLTSGAGGSSYAYMESTAIDSPGDAKLGEDYYLTYAQTVPGDEEFLSPEGVLETGHSGGGYCRITVLPEDYVPPTRLVAEEFDLSRIYPSIEDRIIDDVYLVPYTGAYKRTVLKPGKYHFEAWGGEGGSAASNSCGYNIAGGKGGYTTAVYTATQSTAIYMQVGGKGGDRPMNVSSSQAGGYNGGGSSSIANNVASGGGGGGATDIRIHTEKTTHTNDYDHRILVAGGGGGAWGSDYSNNYTGYRAGSVGGAGGGRVGQGSGFGVTMSYKWNSTYTDIYASRDASYSYSAYYTALGGTQSASRTFKLTKPCTSTANYPYIDAAGFGYGGSTTRYGYNAAGSGGGGGGGWYGGYEGAPAYYNSSYTYYTWGTGGAGGSSYVYTANTHANHPKDGDFLNSKYYLTNAMILSGTDSMPSPTGGTETGHSGDGYLKITVLNPNTTFERENRTFELKSEYMPEESEIKKGDVLNLEFENKGIADEQIAPLTLPKGKYKLEVWGAEGGDNTFSYTTLTGHPGRGGYSRGVLTLTDSTKVYMVAGEKGKPAVTEESFNGGGAAYNYYGSSSGGGGSDIRIGTNDYEHRILVAGGGGGEGWNHTAEVGGDGGGMTGGKPSCNTCENVDDRLGQGGTQTSGGIPARASGYVGYAGTFGKGGNGSGDNSTGGGGGWYGGAGGKLTSAAGGSGYAYTSTSAINHPKDDELGSKYYLEDAYVIRGDNNFLSPYGVTELGHRGQGYCRITVLDTNYEEYEEINPTTYTITSSTPAPAAEDMKDGDIFNVEYTGDYQTIDLPKGEYKLEVWGAEAGQSYSNTFYHSAGKGGYSAGNITLNDNSTKLFVYAGGKGTVVSGVGTFAGGWNGGGSMTTTNSSGYNYYNTTGGGASDIRIASPSLLARVIVAGGGGGASSGSSAFYAHGGDGGGISGGGIVQYNFSYGFFSTNGSQTEGGKGGRWSTYTVGNDGEFGVGASISTGANGGAAGGGGWYGGGSAMWASGGGGSGYVYTSETAVNYPAGCLLNPSYYLTNTELKPGSSVFSSVENKKVTEVGHQGNGYCRITIIKLDKPKVKTNTVYDLTKRYAPNYDKLEVGDVLDLESINDSARALLPQGKYKLEVWGAEGGKNSYSSSYEYYPGKGGYSKGVLSLTDSPFTTVYLAAGEKGYRARSQLTYNGGGKAYTLTNSSSGGGGSDIRIATDSYIARVLVAGGGGGAGYDDYKHHGGYGGGPIGGKPYVTGSNYYRYEYYPLPGTQTQGGGIATYNNEYKGKAGTFGEGGQGSISDDYGAGGGGGWYGGGGGRITSGAGGSGYAYTAQSAESHPNDAYLGEKYYIASASVIAGNEDFLSPSGETETGHSGNGHCRITVLDPNRVEPEHDSRYLLSKEYIPAIDDIKAGDEYILPYIGNEATKVKLPKGKYKLEVWGAEGNAIGTSVTNKGGRGGYAEGVLQLEDTKEFYLYPGEKARDNSYVASANYTFNGGAGQYTFDSKRAPAGGGSDISVKGGLWDSNEHLNSRILVAGGGGGGGDKAHDGITYGYGGGMAGGIGEKHTHNTAHGGSQTKGGRRGYETSDSTYSAVGSFGKGGYGYGNGGGGGGGGWYGGGGNYGNTGAGGSGYVYNAHSAYYHPGDAELGKEYYLASSSIIAGNETFPAVLGGMETGHEGVGYCKITVLDPNEEIEPQRTSPRRFDLTKEYPPASTSNVLVGDTFDLEYYADTYQSVNLPKGNYKLEVWGAEGAQAPTSTSKKGGRGGYAKGIITLDKEEKLFMYAGENAYGTYYNTANYSFNGGGGLSGVNGNYFAVGGGGSDISLSGGLWDSDEHLNNRIVVAGGGGGGGERDNDGITYAYGGGMAGGDGGNYSNIIISSKGGSQSQGGRRGYTLNNSWSGVGKFGKGGWGYGGGGGAGGGGWYGGGGHYGGIGAGGSGYVFTSSSSQYHPNKDKINIKYYLASPSTIPGNKEIPAPTGGTETGHLGQGYCRITVLDPNEDERAKEIRTVPREFDLSKEYAPATYSNILVGDVFTARGFSDSYATVTLPEGKYKLEVWGAQGGNNVTKLASYGGYASGTLAINREMPLFMYAGGQGTSSAVNAAGGYNGGGNCQSTNSRYMNSGGGGSDISIEKGEWYSTAHLYSRLLVAGGGGGCYESGTPTTYSSSGGGVIGIYGGGNTPSQSAGARNGGGGAQTGGGGGKTYTDYDPSYSFYDGSFGRGGGMAAGYNAQYINGAGGGWYGGGAGGPDGGAGGGSGYVYTHTTQGKYPTGCLLNPEYFLKSATTIAGNSEFPSPTGGKETGHTGEGYCKITVLDIHVKRATPSTFDLVTESQPYDTVVGDVYNMAGCNSYRSVILPKGRYKFEVWGAQGCDRNTNSAGRGGYSVGTISVDKEETFYLVAGGKGTRPYGGYNGGANGYSNSVSGYGGGGGSDIRVDTNDYNHRLIVAGGGGGADTGRRRSLLGSTVNTAGSGGGEYGGDGLYDFTFDYSYQKVASNWGGGGGGPNYGGEAYNNTGKGSFGSGGYTSSYESNSGGGGGWYGGGASYDPDGSNDIDGAGGGSGYVYIASKSELHPNNANLGPKYYLENAYTIPGNMSFIGPSGTAEIGHSGNGYCRITVLPEVVKRRATPSSFDLAEVCAPNADEIIKGDEINVSKSLKAGTFVQLPKGKYKLEVWGAEGGHTTASYGTDYYEGRGGYSCGTLALDESKVLYLYAGGQGAGSTGSGALALSGFNGGGMGYSSYRKTTSGGGASDISLAGGWWGHTSFAETHFRNRIIVAGGGGGGRDAGTPKRVNVPFRGAAGGEQGFTGGSYSSSYTSVFQDTFQNGTGGGGGGQYSAGYAGSYFSSETLYSAGFGYGGYTSSGGSYGEGGGGGWYGGGAGSADSDGGGGSGYVYTAGSYVNHPNKDKLLNKYFLTDAKTFSGAQTVPSPIGGTEIGHQGDGYVRITALEVDKTYAPEAMPKTIDLATTMPAEADLKPGTVLDCSYTGDAKSIKLPAGRYKLETWGAQGKYRSGSTASQGAYAVGTLDLNKEEEVFLYSGGEGVGGNPEAKGGFNGGGNAYSFNGRYINSGGGASDIRIGKDSLHSRIIVAGGGGGSDESSTPTNYSSAAGTDYGFQGSYNTGSYSASTAAGDRYGGGGGPTSGGLGRTATSWDSLYIDNIFRGSFGQGGGSVNVKTSYMNGGGGGWYGGGAGGPDGGAGGGSSYVYNSSTYTNYPSGNVLNANFLKETNRLSGSTGMTSPTGTAETGHRGAGHTRISILNPVSEAKRTAPSTFDLSVELMPNEVLTGDVYNVPYISGIKAATLPAGKYKLEVWGAQGGDASVGTDYYTDGGKGGYSVGEFTMYNTNILYVVPGGKGTNSNSISSVYREGGYNGGGYTNGGDGYRASAAGGGASHIALRTGVLSAVTSDYVLIVAGGGGGSGTSTGYQNMYGGYGGGLKGGDGITKTSSYPEGKGGTQTAGGAKGGSTYSNNGSYGQGGYQNGNSSGWSGGGGGGGWYGGGSGSAEGASGGGGSGYVKDILVKANTFGGDTTFISPDGIDETGHEGNGYCRITVLDVENYRPATPSTISLKTDFVSVPTTFLEGDKIDIPFTGNYKSLNLPKGKYKLEVWGAQGGAGSGISSRGNTTPGGRGGYSTGILNLDEYTLLNIYSGGQGVAMPPASAAAWSAVGWNGGGQVYTCGSGGAGGGGTDIRLRNTHLRDRIIVAGGGAGTGWQYVGGAGGGLNGLANNGQNTYGKQTAGGTANNSGGSYAYAGAFGYGGYGSGQSDGGSGGGGGWYGGAGDGYAGWGGGGSGYIYNEDYHSNHPHDINIGEKYYLASASTLDGAQTFLSPDDVDETGHEGNGFARITCIEGYNEFLNIPLCFTAKADNSTVELTKTGSPAWTGEYSLDNKTWNTYTPGTTGAITLAKANDKVYFRGNITANFTEYKHLQFETNGDLSVFGNINSMYKSSGFAKLKKLDYAYCFYSLFYNCSSITDVQNLIFSAESIKNSKGAYSSVFARTGIKNLPKISFLKEVGELGLYCFCDNCYSLTFVPSNYLENITSAGKYAFMYMFSNCAALESAQLNLPLTVLEEKVYSNMFAWCAALKYGPKTLAASSSMDINTSAYAYMFYYAQRLKYPPILPNQSSISEKGMKGMFYGCTSLNISTTASAGKTAFFTRTVDDASAGTEAYTDMLYSSDTSSDITPTYGTTYYANAQPTS